MAGLSAAAALRKAGISVQVLDKARGPGGRSATRRDDDDQFDHGAQYFTCRSPSFTEQVNQWERAGTVARWAGRVVAISREQAFKQSPHPRYVGVPGMNAMCKALAMDVDCRYRHHVTELSYQGRAWQVVDKAGDRRQFDELLVTAPPEQASALLRNTSHPFRSVLDGVRLAPCWALMASFADPVASKFDAAFVNDHECLSWLARDNSKPGRPSGERWVVHANRRWSQQNLEAPKVDVQAALLTAAGQLLETDQVASKTVAHRWRYSQADAPLDAMLLRDAEHQLTIAGDWCAGSRVEGAYLSGCTAGQTIAAAIANRG